MGLCLVSLIKWSCYNDHPAFEVKQYHEHSTHKPPSHGKFYHAGTEDFTDGSKDELKPTTSPAVQKEFER